jgi:hypothetical protein
MAHESGIRQRAIVGRRLDLADSELLTKYTLPFVDATWKVPFTVLDLLGSPPRILAGPLETLSGLFHYDPWWAFRGVSGVDRTWVQAVFATNIARPFVHDGKKLKVHDLQFADGMQRLEAVFAKDEVFRSIEFHLGDLDVPSLRGGSHSREAERLPSTSAKSL